MNISNILEDVGRPVGYYPGLAKRLKNQHATIFLCQLLYWTGKQKDEEGWIYKTREEIYEETALSRDNQETARKVLKSFSILEEQLKGLPGRLHYRININKLVEFWSSPIVESNQAVGDKVANLVAEESPTFYNNIEYYTENTTTESEDSEEKSFPIKKEKKYSEKEIKESILKDFNTTSEKYTPEKLRLYFNSLLTEYNHSEYEPSFTPIVKNSVKSILSVLEKENVSVSEFLPWLFREWGNLTNHDSFRYYPGGPTKLAETPNLKTLYNLLPEFLKAYRASESGETKEEESRSIIVNTEYLFINLPGKVREYILKKYKPPFDWTKKRFYVIIQKDYFSVKEM